MSTSSVYPSPTGTAFEVAGRLGYDGVEVMIGIDAVSKDLDALERLVDSTGVPVLSIHAPTLLVTQGAWGRDPWEKLRRSGQAAHRLGADVVVVHPPFRWQRSYAASFVSGLRELPRRWASPVRWRTCQWRGPRDTVELRVYSPGWDPTDIDYDNLTLDLSHASTSRQSSLELVHAWGERLAHVHLTDGSGSPRTNTSSRGG